MHIKLDISIRIGQLYRTNYFYIYSEHLSEFLKIHISQNIKQYLDHEYSQNKVVAPITP